MEGRTWWWWWWLFYIPDPRNPGRTRQVMILHSTKNSDIVRVMDHVWRRQYRVRREERAGNGGSTEKVLKMHGMSAAWYYDGKEMFDPFLLKDLEMESVTHPDGSGTLTPLGRPDLVMSGDGKTYTVGVANDAADIRMQFKMSQWSPWLSEHRFAKSDFTKKWGYDILKVHAMKMEGTIEGPGAEREEFNGSAYFQKVRVNAPSVPWYWLVLHAENGMYIDYFQPNIGPQMWRRTAKQRSIFDSWWWGERKLRSTMDIYDPATGVNHEFRGFKLRHSYPRGSDFPIFHVEAESATARARFDLATYSRAYWKFAQKHLGGLITSRLYYNEYPAELTSFEFEDLTTGRKLTRADLGFVAANCEQTWGKLY